MQKLKLNANHVGATSSRPHFEGMTLKNQKGITLIALIITIIVMLILVGVTINVALNGGLFQKAETATKETEEKAILEEMLAMMVIDNNGKINPDEIIRNMILEHPEYEIDDSNKPNITITGKLGTYNYIVSETEIKIGESDVPSIDENLKRYILGPKGTGRSLTEIATTTDGVTFIFKDDTSTPDVDETKTLNVQGVFAAEGEDTTKFYGYIKSNNKAYRVIADKTYNTEKLELIYIPKEFEGEDLGEVTGNSNYNGWTILYNNGKTFEAVSPTVMGNLRLGYSETATDSEIQLTEAIESYNSAITIINNYCKNELTGLPTNIGVRSIGSAEEISEADDSKYRSDNLASWNSTYNGTGKKGDTLFEQDLVRMAYHGVISTGEEYWTASRVVCEYSNIVGFVVKRVDDDGYCNGNNNLWYVNSSGNARGNYDSRGVRPIITIQSP